MDISVRVPRRPSIAPCDAAVRHADRHRRPVDCRLAALIVYVLTTCRLSMYTTFSARQHIRHMLSALCAIAVGLSVCLSVRDKGGAKTVEVRIMQFSPYGSPINLFFAG